jgi:hypothetical protein
VTDPIQPTPGAPADPATPQPTTPATPAATTAAEDITSLPDWAQKALRDARAEAAKSRTTAKTQAAADATQEIAARVAKALGLPGSDEPVDPDVLTAQIEQAQAAAWRNGVELAVHRTAGRLGADPDLLLDSNSFIDMLDELVNIDPRSAEFQTALEAKVQEALTKNPNKYKTAGQAPTGPNAPRPDPSQGPRAPGAPARPTSLHAAVAQSLAAQRAPGS